MKAKATEGARRNLGGRPRVGPPGQIRLPAELWARIDKAAKEAGITRAELIRRTLAEKFS